MLKDFLREAITTIVGKQSEKIADLLDSRKPVNEFLIAKKLGLTINQTRNILYRISEHGLVSSMRKKDKKKGWYTYFWKLESLKCLEFLRKISLRKIEQINYQIKSREKKRFYVCEKCNIELNEENALLYHFTCRECGNIFSLKDNTKLLKEFRKNLVRLERELGFIEKEIREEEEKEEKRKSRQSKKKTVKKRKIKSIKKTAKKKHKIPVKKSKIKTKTKKKIRKKISKKNKKQTKKKVKKPVKKKNKGRKKK